MGEYVLNKSRLFTAASIALVVTAMTFAIRANLLGSLSEEFGLSLTQIGEIASAAFWGFAISMLIGGGVCDIVGIRLMYWVAFLSHILGLILTILSVGYWSLFLSTLLVGVANGFIESASYTMVSSIYTNEKSKKINEWHIWFPMGIVIGGLAAYGCTLLDFGWKVQMAVMIPPTLVYGFLFIGQKFPKSERVSMGVTNSEMIKACFGPLFIFMVFCMLITGATELGTNQWIAELLSAVGVPSILLLVFINSIMAISRYNAGTILKRTSSTGLLFFSAIFSFIGLQWLGLAEGYVAFLAAGVFAVGISFSWPTMIGFISENIPKSGPLGLSIMGSVGLLSTALIMPYFGSIYETQLSNAIPPGVDYQELLKSVVGSSNYNMLTEAKIIAGSYTLQFASILPAILIPAFGILLFISKKPKTIMSKKL
jgi:MFS family permease